MLLFKPICNTTRENGPLFETERDQVRAARDSPFLTESRILAHNFDDPRRVRRDHYKGMSQEQLAAIRAEQEAQRRELEARRADEKAEAAECVPRCSRRRHRRDVPLFLTPPPPPPSRVCARASCQHSWAERVKQQVAAAAEMDAADEAERLASQRDYYLALKAQQRAAKLAYVACGIISAASVLPLTGCCHGAVFGACRRRAQQEEYTNKIDKRYFDKFNQTSHN